MDPSGLSSDALSPSEIPSLTTPSLREAPLPDLVRQHQVLAPPTAPTALHLIARFLPDTRTAGFQRAGLGLGLSCSTREMLNEKLNNKTGYT